MTALASRNRKLYKFGFTIMHKNEEILLVEWNPTSKGTPKVKTTPISRTKHWAVPNALFGSCPSLADIEKFLESRCFDRTRDDTDQLLKRYQLSAYHPLSICKKSYGRKMEDMVWIRFDDMETVTYDNIKLRRM